MLLRLLILQKIKLIPFMITKSLTTILAMGSLGFAAEKQEKLNIILFLVDDMGWQDTSVPFHTEKTEWNKRFKTPNMERLAAMGVKFTNAYAASVSSPSRVSLLTGTNPTRHHVTNWTLHKNTSSDGHNRVLNLAKWNVNGFTPDASVENAFYGTSLAQMLKNNGYMNLFVGKAHFGARGTPASNPLNIGFDRNVGGHAAGAPASYLGEKNYGKQGSNIWGVPHLEKYHGKDVFLTEALTLEAELLMDEALADKKPFFLYMSHYAAHAPFDADKRYYAKYKELGFDEQEARYASIIEGMDKSLGDLMDYLNEKGIADNTIILFMSDNGGYSIGVRANTFGGINKNAPLRGGKGSLYEGGIREPMLVYVPNMTKPGSVNASPVIIEDFYPTILDLVKAKGKPAHELDSVTFLPALKGEKINAKRPFFWHYPNDWAVRGNECGAPQSAVRLGSMKLIHDYETSSNQLYDIAKDLEESNNLLGKGKKNDEIARHLAKVLSDKLRQDKSPMPSFKATGKLCPYPDETIK